MATARRIRRPSKSAFFLPQITSNPVVILARTSNKFKTVTSRFITKLQRNRLLYTCSGGLKPYRTMCDYEEFVFTCTHSTIRLKSYCHFARNDPNHQCFGVKKLRNVWDQNYECERCREQKGGSPWGQHQHLSYGGYGMSAGGYQGQSLKPKTFTRPYVAINTPHYF